MSLQDYKKKRDFKKTSEPSGGKSGSAKTGSRKSSGGKPVYVIQKHDARNLHYDLRLEFGGVLKSWAIPKEPPTEPGVKRLAVETEDHPLDYANFEGEIPEGEYGAGKVEIWDKGWFKVEKTGEKDIIVEIHGKKLKGTYVLFKFEKTGSKNWLIFKKND